MPQTPRCGAPHLSCLPATAVATEAARKAFILGCVLRCRARSGVAEAGRRRQPRVFEPTGIGCNLARPFAGHLQVAGGRGGAYRLQPWTTACPAGWWAVGVEVSKWVVGTLGTVSQHWLTSTAAGVQRWEGQSVVVATWPVEWCQWCRDPALASWLALWGGDVTLHASGSRGCHAVVERNESCRLRPQVRERRRHWRNVQLAACKLSRCTTSDLVAGGWRSGCASGCARGHYVCR